MASSSSDSKASNKKRVGRKRLPALPPLSAPLFVVVNDPIDFKAKGTMRQIRSEVMYKHRGSSPSNRVTKSRSGSIAQPRTRTPSPRTTNSDGVLEDNTFLSPIPMRPHSTSWDKDFYPYDTRSPSVHPMRALVARIVAANTTQPARSAPLMFEEPAEFPFNNNIVFGEESLEDLKQDYINNTEFFCHDQSWMRNICDNRLSFLSHASVNCVYQDLSEGLLYDTEPTVFTKGEVLRGITDRLDIDDTTVVIDDTTIIIDDTTIVSILHLLVSEIGGFNENNFDIHMQAVLRIVLQRGGLTQLSPTVATFISLVIMSCAILRGQVEPTLLQDLSPRRQSALLPGEGSSVSPLCAPYGDMSRIYRSCAIGTFEIVRDMYLATQAFLARWKHAGESHPTSGAEVATCDSNLRQIYSHLLGRPSAAADPLADWKYESCRLAALIYCRSLVHGTTLAESANVLHPQSPGSNTEPTTLLLALHAALMRTDTRSCWGDEMRGVFLWVCLVGGAASWSSSRFASVIEGNEPSLASAWARKCFALYAVRAAVSVSSDHAETTVQALRTMLEVRQWLDFTTSSLIGH